MRQRVTRSPRQEAIAGAMLSESTKGTGCEMNQWDDERGYSTYQGHD